MKKIILILVIALSLNIFANDGAYLSHGGVIFPINENNISMEKEILSFKVRDEICYVNVQFTFNNPKNEYQKLLVGFQAPGPFGDLDQKDKGNGIKGFTIFYENKIVPYELKRAHDEDGKLYSLKDFVPEDVEENSGIYVYLFEIEFKPGLNIVNHSYSFPASTNVIIKNMYNYILTTGARWADNTIKNLTIEIDMGNNQYFYVEDIFENKAKWSIIGTGKIVDKNIAGLEDNYLKMIRIISGYLKIELNNFTPKANIDFGIINEKTFAMAGFVNTDIEKKLSELEYYNDENDYSKEQLKFFRNAIYAKYGYDFKDQSLKKLYSQYEWYIPNPNLDINEINMTQLDNELLRKIMEQEKLMK
ncbi:YARHG domain-containing protein [Fusobacterium sp. PH5-44]|uniref:YARHG domain-containing protein n=1 Tax=unclassified Fusobacterium TaxID=2648384 RepID=UPI003D1E8990